MKKKYFVSTVRRLLVLLTVLLTGSHVIQADPVAQAVWCEGNSTLYFVRQNLLNVGDDFDGTKVTQVWSGDAVTAISAENKYTTPGWYDEAVRNNATTIKFDVSFAAVASKNINKWVNGFKKVT